VKIFLVFETISSRLIIRNGLLDAVHIRWICKLFARRRFFRNGRAKRA